MKLLFDVLEEVFCAVKLAMSEFNVLLLSVVFVRGLFELVEDVDEVELILLINDVLVGYRLRKSKCMRD
jgi:hypothetical protein